MNETPDANRFGFACEKLYACEHLCYNLDEASGWAQCTTCKERFIYDEWVHEAKGEMQCYSQEYSSVRNFAKYLRKLRTDNPYLPDYMPLQNGYIRFVEAYNRIQFRNKGKLIGNNRNLFGNKYTLFRLAQVLAEFDSEYQLWVDYVQFTLGLPPEGQVVQLNDHWTELNVMLPVEWQSKRELTQPLAHLRPRK